MFLRTLSLHDVVRAVQHRHWEGDLLFGSKNSQIATLVERHTRYPMLVKVSGKDSETVINALIKHARKLPEELYKSLTWDRGSEMLRIAGCITCNLIRNTFNQGRAGLNQRWHALNRVVRRAS